MGELGLVDTNETLMPMVYIQQNTTLRLFWLLYDWHAIILKMLMNFECTIAEYQWTN